MDGLARQLARHRLLEIAYDRGIAGGELIERGRTHPPNLAGAGRDQSRLRMRSRKARAEHIAGKQHGHDLARAVGKGDLKRQHTGAENERSFTAVK